MKILAIIPARGGSKGIPRKNVRLMNGKPLIAYAIQNALNCSAITDVVISSDDEEILSVGAKYGATPLNRDSALAQDAVTLNPVIYDAVLQMEAKQGYKYDIVICMQATAPLLSLATLTDAIESFIASGADTYISACNKPHLAWTKNEAGEFVPLYKERLNRQQLPPNYVEAGAVTIAKREFVSATSFIGKKVCVYEIPDHEATDIDDVSDWVTCESRLKAQTIVFRCDGHSKLGMMHVKRCLTLAYHFIGHNVVFVTREDWADGAQLIKSRFFPCHTIRDDQDFFDLLSKLKPNVVVNDCLDTTKDYMLELKKHAGRVVTFEDLGEGAALADAVINALHDADGIPKHYYGEKYIDLRDEFLLAEPIEIKKEVKNTLVMFGGTDPNGLTKKLYSLALKYTRDGDMTFTFVVDPAFDLAYNGIAATEKIKIFQKVSRVSDLMEDADIAFTSGGRTVFELATLGIPTIVMAQGPRELSHSFAHMQNGFMNLGVGKDVSDETVENTFLWLCGAYDIRRDMSRLMQKHDLRLGIERVKKIILGGNL